MKITMRDGTGTVHLKFVVEDMDRHGNVRVYVRRAGRKVRLTEATGTDEFMAEYRAALVTLDSGGPVKKAGAVAAPGSIRWLVERYYDSAAFVTLEESTRKARRRMLDAFCERHGNKRYRHLEARHIAGWRDEKVRAGAPEAGNGLVKVLRALFGWATDPEVRLAEVNPARDVKRIITGSTGYHTWTVEEVFQFEDRHRLVVRHGWRWRKCSTRAPARQTLSGSVGRWSATATCTLPNGRTATANQNTG